MRAEVSRPVHIHKGVLRLSTDPTTWPAFTAHLNAAVANLSGATTLGEELTSPLGSEENLDQTLTKLLEIRVSLANLTAYCNALATASNTQGGV